MKKSRLDFILDDENFTDTSNNIHKQDIINEDDIDSNFKKSTDIDIDSIEDEIEEDDINSLEETELSNDDIDNLVSNDDIDDEEPLEDDEDTTEEPIESEAETKDDNDISTEEEATEEISNNLLPSIEENTNIEEMVVDIKPLETDKEPEEHNEPQEDNNEVNEAANDVEETNSINFMNVGDDIDTDNVEVIEKGEYKIIAPTTKEEYQLFEKNKGFNVIDKYFKEHDLKPLEDNLSQEDIDRLYLEFLDSVVHEIDEEQKNTATNIEYKKEPLKTITEAKNKIVIDSSKYDESKNHIGCILFPVFYLGFMGFWMISNLIAIFTDLILKHFS